MKSGRFKTPKPKLGSTAVVLFCFFFFVAGFFAAILLSPDGYAPRTSSRVSVSVGENHEAMPFGETGDGSIHTIPFQILSWKPRAVYFPGFASPEQCQKVIDIAKVNLKPSSLALREGETDESTKGTRTSSGTFMSGAEDKTGVLAEIEEKIARVTMLPRSHGEDFNILRYNLGQKYDSHYDAFNPSEYGPQKSQRIASFLLYLSDVEEGGETMFPIENGAEIDEGFDFRKCTGLRVKPRRGDGLLFYSVYPNGTIDQLSLHGSCPVIKGEKWVATKWIKDQVESY